MLRKPIILMFTLVSVFAALALTTAASASAAQRIDMKVLLLGTSTTEPDFVSWQSALQREGVPFETIITSAGHTPITAATLSDTLANGTPEGKYQGIIVSVGNLPVCTSTCVSTLSQTEWAALEEYEQTFNVRQITGDVFPGANFGLNSPTVSGEFAKGAQGTLTTEGKTVFPYLKGTVPMDTGTYGYQATPLTTQVTGASYHTLVSGPGSSALVGIYTDPTGVQEMVETFDQNQNQLQAELLRHGAINWVTRGVYFGDQRNYLETDIDDNFLPDDTWNTETHTTDYTPANALREEPVDVEYAAKWGASNNFRIDMLFNGGGSATYAENQTTGIDPLVAAFATYKNSFGWINHTYDHPNLDIGCATQAYAEAEIAENNTWVATNLGLTESTSPTAALGNDNPSVVVTGEHSGLANLLPGNPGVVDPPNLSFAEAEVSESKEKGSLTPGSYTYAVTDDFAANGGQSIASISSPVTVAGTGATGAGTVSLSWQAVCHAAQFKIYREVTGSNKWELIETLNAPTAAPPNAWFANPTVNTAVTGGGPLEVTFTDTGQKKGTPVSGLPAVSESVETPYPENPNLSAAFTGVGIKFFGADASKAYPNPAIAGSITPAYPAGTSFTDGTAQSIPRYPTNIYYNASTEAQEVDEFNTLYTPTSQGGKCTASSTTTCESSPATFASVVSDVDTNMFQHMMGNDPRPHYFHQPNMMGSPPPGPATAGTPPATSPTVGDGLYYSVMNPLLEQYNSYFNAPLEQPTMAQIGAVLGEQQEWSAASASQVSGYIEGKKITITNSGSSAVNTPLTGVTGVGSSYGGITSGWTSAPAATSTHEAPTTWPVAPEPVQEAPQGSWVGKYGSSGYVLAGWDGAQDASNMPNVTETLVQGSRYQWAPNTTDVRALQSPDGSTRNAAADYDAKEVKVQLGFATAYTGNLRLYAVDWDSLGRRETITVNDGSGPRSVPLNTSFSKGAWVTFPVNVAAGGTVSINVVNNIVPATTNAVLSGIFLGENGAPPVASGQELSEGGWVGSFGSAGYDLAGWDGSVGDVSYMPNATVSLVQGSRWQWIANTTDPRALSEPGQLTRNAATYYDPKQIDVQLSFPAAYTGDIHLYAVDWDSTARRETISVNGQVAVLSSSFNKGAWVSFPISVKAGGTVTVTVDRTAGLNAVLSGIFLGDAGSPPAPTVASAPQGAWTKTVGSAGYDLASWNGSSGDVSYLPGASLNLVQGNRWQWAANSADPRALTDPAGATANIGTYYDPNEIQLQLNFKEAYKGNLHLYAVDWDHLTRREIITVNGQSVALGDFSEGAWVSFPINVEAGGTVTITVDRTFGLNAVLSGIFLGEGAPPTPTVASAPQGNWVGTYGKEGYDLAGWEGESDLTSLTKASLTVEQASRYTWTGSTEDVRALESPDKTTRTAATYYDPNEIKLKLTFSAAYTGTLHLYALDWDSQGRREIISVNGQVAVLSNEFVNGAWVSFPVSVEAGGTVAITVSRLAGSNAVLSGIFLG